jgi:hypothetical protein
MCLGLLADRGAKMLGSFELTYLARHRDQATKKVLALDADNSPKECLINSSGDYQVGSSEDGSRINAFQVSGLAIEEAAVVLNSRACKTTAAHLPRAKRQGSQRNATFWRDTAERLIQCYVDSRLPVIMYVDSDTWYGMPGFSDDGHVVVIAGYRKNSPAACHDRKLADLIVHDPSLRPFITVDRDYCFEASEKMQQEDNGTPPQLLFCAPENIDYHAVEFLEIFLGGDLDGNPLGRQGIRKKRSLKKLNKHAVRHDVQVTSFFCDARDRDRFDQLAEGKTGSSDWSVSLCHRDDIFETWIGAHSLYAGAESNVGKRSHHVAVDTWQSRVWPMLEDDYYWVFSETLDSKLTGIWICNPRGGIKLPGPRTAPLEQRCWECRILVDAATGRIDLDYDARLCVRDARYVENSQGSQGVFHVDSIAHGPVSRSKVGNSVISSSSEWPLSTLLNEVALAAPEAGVDLFLLRDCDIEKCVSERNLEPKDLPKINGKSQELASTVLAFDPWRGEIADWLLDKIKVSGECTIPAFATFFPSLTRGETFSADKQVVSSNRDESVRALANAVLIGMDLNNREPVLFPNIVVEAVCGTRLDRCRCNRCDSMPLQPVFVGNAKKKLRRLFQSLGEVVEIVKKDPAYTETPWTIALESEPGVAYLLNSWRRLSGAVELLNSDFSHLREYVSFNLDIAHMRMAGISAVQLSTIEDYISHGHICDHPDMHTKDHPPGAWNSSQRIENPDYGYIRVLKDAFIRRGREGLAASHSLSVELEGCSRFQWIQSGLGNVRYMLDAEETHRSLVRSIHGV